MRVGAPGAPRSPECEPPTQDARAGRFGRCPRPSGGRRTPGRSLAHIAPAAEQGWPTQRPRRSQRPVSSAWRTAHLRPSRGVRAIHTDDDLSPAQRSLLPPFIDDDPDVVRGLRRLGLRWKSISLRSTAPTGGRLNGDRPDPHERILRPSPWDVCLCPETRTVKVADVCRSTVDDHAPPRSDAISTPSTSKATSPRSARELSPLSLRKRM